MRVPPVVTVVIPCYNGAEFLGEAITSACSQDYKPLEVVVVDDASTDDTPSILKHFFKGQVKVVTHLKNKGCSAALNSGIKASSGDLICWLSADDRFHHGKVKLQVKHFLEADPDVAAIYTDYATIDTLGDPVATYRCHPVPDKWMLSAIIVNNFVNGSSVMMRKDAIESVGLFDETLRADSDGDMWMRLLGAGYRLLHLPRVTMSYRRHKGQMSTKAPLMHRDTDLSRVKAIEAADSTEDLLGGLENLRVIDACFAIGRYLRGRGRTKAADAIEKRGLDYDK